MLVPRRADMRHKSNMFKLLSAILKDKTLSSKLYFKGGTCAALRGVLPRFSVDLDFDLLEKSLIPTLRPRIIKLTQNLGFTLKEQSQHALQFFLKYEAHDQERNTLKLGISDLVSPKNEYELVNLEELNLVCQTQTIPTMVANKLVAALGRLERNGHVSGRDFYDIREFLLAGLPINKSVVEERTGQKYLEYLDNILKYVKKNLTLDQLYRDLNPLLPPKNFKHVVDQIIPDLTMLLTDELARKE